MIKLLHFADVHIGMENYGRTDPSTGLSTRVMDFLRRMDEMVGFAEQRAIDLAIFAGDAFKTRNPNPTFQREFAWRILDLAKICPVVLLVGNHDLPINIKKASSLEIYDTLRVPNVTLGDQYKLHLVETKSGIVQVATAPYPVRARLLEGDDELSTRRTIADLDSALRRQLELVIRELAHQADKSEAPRILTGHFWVDGAMTGSERQVMIGRDVAIGLAEIADPAWDYVALGHVHRHQNLTAGRNDAPPVIYSGSMERIDFSEEGDEKGFIYAEIERGYTQWEFVPLPKSRRFLTVRADVRHAGNPTQVVLEEIARTEIEDAVVRVIIKTDPETHNLIQMKTIEQAIRDSGASIVAAIQRDVQHPARMRLGPTPEGLSPLELMERYFQSKEVLPERIDELLQVAQEFFVEEESAGY